MVIASARRRAVPTRAAPPRGAATGRSEATDRSVGAPSLLLVVVAVLERAPEQHGDDEREDDHFLERARVERAEALERADQQGAERRRRVARQAAEDRGDEALQADQEARVVEDRRRRPDEQTREGTDERRQAEAQLAGTRRRDCLLYTSDA